MQVLSFSSILHVAPRDTHIPEWDPSILVMICKWFLLSSQASPFGSPSPSGTIPVSGWENCDNHHGLVFMDQLAGDEASWASVASALLERCMRITDHKQSIHILTVCLPWGNVSWLSLHWSFFCQFSKYSRGNRKMGGSPTYLEGLCSGSKWCCSFHCTPTPIPSPLGLGISNFYYNSASQASPPLQGHFHSHILTVFHWKI